MSEVDNDRGESAGGRGRWTFLSWLRRDERSCSSDSLSSAGSDRTTASFAYLAPPPPRTRAAAVPSQLHAPPTDSYKKRLHDRHLQRKQDNNLTLHRKYGLYFGYDAFSLPPSRKRHEAATDDEKERDRRATSESLPRRIAHVPGKRRAPQPPARPHSVALTSSLVRRHSRKRPAPPPPTKLYENSKENIGVTTKEDNRLMNYQSVKTESSDKNVTNEDEPDKHKKKSVKDIGKKADKNFLKQIFENKKRNSVIDQVPERILPSISELDKQAAEIIELFKLKPLEQNNNISGQSGRTWYCTKCLRKYDSTTVTCQHCIPEQRRLNSTAASSLEPSTSCNRYSQTKLQTGGNNVAVTSHRRNIIKDDEKQKLKEMLKEMKNSLPKRSNEESSNKTKESNEFDFNKKIEDSGIETPTLRIGVTDDNKRKSTKDEEDSRIEAPTLRIGGTDDDKRKSTKDEASTSDNNRLASLINPRTSTQNVLITQHVVLVGPKSITSNVTGQSDPLETHLRSNNGNPTNGNTNYKNLQSPLKISTLLNPVYVPKNDILSDREAAKKLVSQKEIASSSDGLKRNSVTDHTNNNDLELPGMPKPEPSKPSIANDIDIEGNIKVKPENCNTSQNTKETNESLTKTNMQQKMSPTQEILSKASTSAEASQEKKKLVQSNMAKLNIEQHSRRRDLINQLEQSIAKGDERAAADAASKLAQLRLSCSVLSFSSQIMGGGVKSAFQKEQKSCTNNNEVISASCSKDTVKSDTAVQQITSSVKTKAGELEQNNLKKEEKPELTSVLSSVEDKDNRTRSQVAQTSERIVNGENLTTIQVWVEDRDATRGPVLLRMPRRARMDDLRRQAETTLGLAVGLQRWIVGRTLCTDYETPLVSLAGPDLSVPFYLCVVDSDTRSGKILVPNTNDIQKANEVYLELIKLEQCALVSNIENFECTICMEECATGEGTVLRECVHAFCKRCLSDLVKHCEEPMVACPATECPGFLQEREVRALVTQNEYEKWLRRSLIAAENSTRNAFHCRTRDCVGWAFCDPGVRKFPCPVCKQTNCLLCQAIHEGVTCEQYRSNLQAATSSMLSDDGTQTLLKSLIKKGEALECPECKAIITKKWGCDWVKCSACKTEICWVTRGRRWGPAGKGDTSGGCRCGVDGKKCHPSCGYCH